MMFEGRALLLPEEEYTRRRRSVAEGEVLLEDLPVIMGIRLYHLRIILVGFCGWLTPSMTISTIPYILDDISGEFGVEQSQAVLVGSMVLFGGILGTIFCGPVTDRFGRRFCIVTCCVFTGVLSCLHLLLPGKTMTGFFALLALRFAIGIFFASLCVITPVYVLEFIPDEYRGRVVSGLGFGWIAGSVVCILCAKFFKDSWRLLLALPVIPSLCCLLFCFLSPESLRWLFVVDRQDEGNRALRSIMSSQLLVGQECHMTGPPQVVLPNVHTHSTKRGFLKQLSLLFGPDLRCATVVCMLLWAATCGSDYSMGYWAPHTLKKLSGAADFAYDVFLWVQVANVASCLAATLVLDMFGRKMGYFCSAVPAGLLTCLFPLAVIKGGMVAVYVCLLSQALFIGIVWAVLNAYCIEAFPTNLRASGGGISAIAGRVSAGLVPMAVGSLLEVSVYLGYCVTGGVLLIGAAAALFIPQEMVKAKLADEV